MNANSSRVALSCSGKKVNGKGRWLVTAALCLLQVAFAETDVKAAGFTATGSLNTARDGHTQTLLQNGKVLVVGGWNNTAELYDPATETWSTTGSLSYGRIHHTATLLQNGKVLVTGGGVTPPSSSCELYDPATGTWSVTGSMVYPRQMHNTVLLADGKVLAVGWDGLGRTEVYDPSTGTWTATGTIGGSERAHAQAVLLQNGKVLLMGGNVGIYPTNSFLFNPSTGTWSTTGSFVTGRGNHTATLLPNGKVLMAGGGNSSTQFNDAQLYDPATGTWSATGSMSTNRVRHAAVLLPSGKVLVAGGFGGGSSTAELYDPSTGTWSMTGSMTANRVYQSYGNLTLTWLPSVGKALIAGGWYSTFYSGAWHPVTLDSAELYTPDESTTTSLLTGLKGYWKLDETNGMRFDSTANAFDLTEFNTVYSGAGILNNAAVIDASIGDQGLHSTGTVARSTLSFSNSWTVSSWVYASSNQVWSGDNIFSKAGEVYLWRDTNNELTAHIQNGAPNYDILISHTFDYVLPEEAWHHLVLQRCGDSINLFVDGAFKETVNMHGAVTNGGYDFWIGMQEYGWPWNGLIDEVGYWGRSLNTAEITALYGNGTPPTCGVSLLTGLKGYWKLDESSGVRYDSSANSFDLSEFSTVQYSTNGVLNGASVFDASLGDQGLHSTGSVAQSTLAFTNNWTVSTWVVGSSSRVWSGDNIFTKSGELYLWREWNNQLTVHVMSGSPNYDILLSHTFNYALPEDEWHHVALKRDGNTIYLYVDGYVEESVGVSGSITDGGYDFWIGMQEYGWPWNGLVDETGYWGRCLNDLEINALGSGIPPAFETFTDSWK